MDAAQNLQHYIDLFYNTRGVKRVRRFSRKYSSQLGFTFLVFVFLTVTIGEGQANNISVPKLAAQLAINNDGFIGKPVILASQTVLTGELQQDVVIIYTVERGDTISSIAARYNLSVGTILDKNNIKPIDAEKIAVGTKLAIPAIDTNSSVAWLETLNRARDEQRRLAESERQRQQQEVTTSRDTNLSYRTGGYTVLGKMYGTYNGGLPGWCTWYVNYRRPDLPNGMGNARDYLASARSRGIPTGSTPQVGAIMVTKESYYGHVAYVSAVSSNSFTVIEMNYVGRYIVSSRSVPKNFWAIRGFVYKN